MRKAEKDPSPGLILLPEGGWAGGVWTVTHTGRHRCPLMGKPPQGSRGGMCRGEAARRTEGPASLGRRSGTGEGVAGAAQTWLHPVERAGEAERGRDGAGDVAPGQAVDAHWELVHILCLWSRRSLAARGWEGAEEARCAEERR